MKKSKSVERVTELEAAIMRLLDAYNLEKQYCNPEQSAALRDIKILVSAK